MFTINADLSIHITRGDIGVIQVSVDNIENNPYVFKPGDVVRLRVYPKRQHENVVLAKDVVAESDTEVVDINLERVDTKIGPIINKPTTYWYEIELNPDTTPRTLVGYDEVGPKLFILYPEGGDVVCP